MAGPSFNLYAIRRGRLIVHLVILHTRYLHTRLILHIYNGVHPPQICAFMYTVNCFLTQLSYCTIICTENNRLLQQILLFSLAKKAPFSHNHGIQALLNSFLFIGFRKSMHPARIVRHLSGPALHQSPESPDYIRIRSVWTSNRSHHGLSQSQ